MSDEINTKPFTLYVQEWSECSIKQNDGTIQTHKVPHTILVTPFDKDIMNDVQNEAKMVVLPTEGILITLREQDRQGFNRLLENKVVNTTEEALELLFNFQPTDFTLTYAAKETAAQSPTKSPAA